MLNHRNIAFYYIYSLTLNYLTIIDIMYKPKYEYNVELQSDRNITFSFIYALTLNYFTIIVIIHKVNKE